MKRFISFVLAVAMLLGCVFEMPFVVQAAGSGTCGENVTWQLSDEGVLTISGTGEMTDYLGGTSGIWTPWDGNVLINSVIIEEGITRIGNFAFINCRGLRSITIPDSVISIGDSVFYNCSSLTNITIPDSVTSIGAFAFNNCSSLTSIAIPEGVTIIEDGTFRGCSGVTSITIPESVTSISDDAFSRCTGLTNITIGNGVTSIGVSAFYGCSSLTSITIPDSVSDIGRYAFYNCSSLTNITLPESVTSIGNYAFYGCSSLNHVLYTGTEAQWSAVSIGEDNSVLTNATLHCNATGSEIVTINQQNCVADILWKCIVCDYQCEIPIEGGFHNVVDGVCTLCGELHQHNFDETTRQCNCGLLGGTCGENLIWTLDSAGLLTISGTGPMDDMTNSNGISGNTPWIKYQGEIKEVVIEEGVTNISRQAFTECPYLEKATIAATVTEIGVSAFAMTNLREIVIPAGVTQIGSSAFSYSNLGNIRFMGSAPEIGENAFYYVTATAHYPSCDLTWTLIEGKMSDYGGKITWMPYDISGTCGDALTWKLDKDGVLTISGTGPMDDMSNPMGNSGNTPWASYRPFIKEAVIEEGVTSIGTQAFAALSKLSKVSIANTVTEIGQKAFNMTSLKTIVIPDSVIRIGNYAFMETGLKSVTLPNSVTSIGEGAFDLSLLTDVYYIGTEAQKALITIGSNAPLTSAKWHYCVSTNVETTVGGGEVMVPGDIELNADIIDTALNAAETKNDLAAVVAHTVKVPILEAISALGDQYDPNGETPVAQISTYLKAEYQKPVGNSMTVDLKAVYQAYAVQGENSAKIGEEKSLDTEGQAITVTIVLPASFVEGKLGAATVKHYKDGGELVEIYENLTINKSAQGIYTVTFTDTKGFSEFEVIIEEAHAEPEITLTTVSMSFENEVFYNLYYTVENLNVSVEDMGLLVWHTNPGEVENYYLDADEVLPGALSVGLEYMVRTNGVAAKDMGDKQYMRVYAKLSDGTYVYSRQTWCSGIYYAGELLKSTNETERALGVAILNYGAAAQEYFAETSDYSYEKLMNSDLTSEQQALVREYSVDMVNPLKFAAEEKTTHLPETVNAFSSRQVSVTFDGTLYFNFYFTPGKTVDDKLTFYYWTQEAYDSADVLTLENSTGHLTPTAMGDGRYRLKFDDIAAKEIDKTIYYYVVYESNGETCATGIKSYSLGYYCTDVANNYSGVTQSLAKATLVYGYYAKAYFTNKH